MWPVTGIPRAPYGLLKIRIVSYYGAPLILPDATGIHTGVLIAELHCNNRAILELVSRGNISPYRACREDLRSLACWLSQADPRGRVRALYGFTLLTPAAVRLGFSVRQRPVTVHTRFDRMYMTGLLLLYTVSGIRRLNHGKTVGSYPQEIWMSRAELMRRYGARSRHAGATGSTERPVVLR